MSKFGRFAALLCLCALFLAGCGEAGLPDVIEAPTVSVDKEGRITVWQVGDFGKTYYNISELTSMAVEEAKQYNTEKGKNEAVIVEKVEALTGNRVVVSYLFDGWESCADFMGEMMFCGTVNEAVAAGFDTDVIMRNVSDNTLFTEEQLKQAGDRQLIITEADADIYCPSKVTHVTDGASLNNDGSVNAAAVGGPVYILLR